MLALCIGPERRTSKVSPSSSTSTPISTPVATNTPKSSEKTSHHQPSQQAPNPNREEEEENEDEDEEWVKAECIVSDQEDSLERSQPSLTVSPTTPEMLTPIPLSNHTSPSPSVITAAAEKEEKSPVNHSVESSVVTEIEKIEENKPLTMEEGEEGSSGEEKTKVESDQIGMALSPRQDSE